MAVNNYTFANPVNCPFSWILSQYKLPAIYLPGLLIDHHNLMCVYANPLYLLFKGVQPQGTTFPINTATEEAITTTCT